MKILLVTGRLAKDYVRKHALESHVEFDVIALPIPVAALMTSRYVAQELKSMEIKGYDMILVPGMIFGDPSLIEQAVNIPTFKGPRYAADLPVILDSLERVKLSKTFPACSLLKDELRRRALSEIASVERNRDILLNNPGNLLIGNLAVGKDFPMRVMAEIVDAPLKSDEEIRKRAIYYVSSGADIVDIGMIAGESRPADAKRAVKAVKRVLNVPVSIDTIDPDEAEAGVSAGADMILSIDGGNVEEMARFASKVAGVVIPTNHRKSYFPKEVEGRIRVMEENMARARHLGVNKILADLILDSVIVPGAMESLTAFFEFRRRWKDIPMLCGVGNVTELMDADSVGVNALIAGLAAEIGINILLTTEVSDKARGSVQELATASKMMFLAKKRDSTPKGLGIDLLLYKERKNVEEVYDPKIENNLTVVEAGKFDDCVVDPKGCFKIMLDRENEKIVVIHYGGGKPEEPSVIVKGKNASNLYRTIVKMNLMSSLDHAAYLGYELGKAEVALKTGRSYIQDHGLFDRNSHESH
jgi:dihydropteroate synthase-like protein